MLVKYTSELCTHSVSAEHYHSFLSWFFSQDFVICWVFSSCFPLHPYCSCPEEELSPLLTWESPEGRVRNLPCHPSCLSSTSFSMQVVLITLFSQVSYAPGLQSLWTAASQASKPDTFSTALPALYRAAHEENLLVLIKCDAKR